MTGAASDSIAGVHEGNFPWQRDCCIRVVGVFNIRHFNCQCKCGNHGWSNSSAFDILGCKFPQLPHV